MISIIVKVLSLTTTGSKVSFPPHATFHFFIFHFRFEIEFYYLVIRSKLTPSPTLILKIMLARSFHSLNDTCYLCRYTQYRSRIWLAKKKQQLKLKRRQ